MIEKLSISVFTFSKSKQVIQVGILSLLLGCQSTSINELQMTKAGEGFAPQNADELFVVDCLLQGQIRKMGTSLTYLSARRPIKTTAKDCELRGGEYVAYDRANYASALKVWLPQAQQGDANAQVTLGEIYENGLGGGLADPALAAEWYKKAAAQGNSRAQLNLGNLYEKGLGVEKDVKKALNLYRQASGLSNTDLEFASVTKAEVTEEYEQKIQQMQLDFQAKESEVAKLRQQLQNSKTTLLRQRKTLSTLEQRLGDTRKQLENEKNKPTSNPQLVSQLEEQLKTELSALSVQKGRVNNQQQQQIELAKAKLATQKAQLATQETGYYDATLQIKKRIQQISEKAQAATTTREKLEVQQLREKLNLAKADLVRQGKQVKQLKEKIDEDEKILVSLERKSVGIMLANAQIEIIEPPITLTRAIPTYQLRSLAKKQKIIGKIKEFGDLKALKINDTLVTVDENGVFRSFVDIDSDRTEVEIIADYKNKTDSSVINFNLLAKDDKPIVANTATYPTVTRVSKTYPSIDFGDFYALIIGNKDYTQLPVLNTPINDAKAIEDVLRTQYGYKTILLTNASRYQVMSAFNDLRNKLTEKDNLLIYYAGHGEIDQSDQSAYWLPTDAEQNNTANWLSSHNITQFINILPAKHILVVADSCYSGAMTETTIARLPDSIDEAKRKKWLQFMTQRKARTVLTSGGVQPVLDSGSDNHSVFANAFLRVLRNNTGLMEDYELYREVYGNVKESSSRVGFYQEPQYSAMQHAGHEGSPYFFVPNTL